ncbi:CDP-glucose 4,6-dehydratase [Candidatus Pacearchaeota archaeon]|nr:CDP-glucose 4,6-dehydratase [Candidatus Pacearchaeota archaeon]
MSKKLSNIFQGKKILVTGHTGFKGSWLSIWLRELGAKVIGYSSDPPTKPSNFILTKLAKKIVDIRGDIRDIEKLDKVIRAFKPEIIFHLAAQAIVLTSYSKPKETFDINVGGTINVLEAARHYRFVKSIVIITSDKCYKDQSIPWGYRETDLLGGDDPYSASKGMAELAVSSYRVSFYNEKNKLSIASARAGNVIGGGDFADFRLVPDTMKSLITGNNFGPLETSGIKAQEVVEKSIFLWGKGSWKHIKIEKPRKETKLLRLSWEKAAQRLHWAPAYTWEEALESTVEWFKAYSAQRNNPEIDLYDLCVKQIRDYTEKAREKKIEWAV